MGDASSGDASRSVNVLATGGDGRAGSDASTDGDGARGGVSVGSGARCDTRIQITSEIAPARMPISTHRESSFVAAVPRLGGGAGEEVTERAAPAGSAERGRGSNFGAETRSVESS